jgi:transposase
LPPVVEALQAPRGGQCIAAVTMVAEIGDLPRLESPRALMTSWGLLPAEDTSAERRRQGPLTNAGNTHARSALVDGAWASRYPAKVSRHLQLRLEPQPTIIQDIRWKAQVRLCQRYRQLIARGKHANVVTVAIARELAGCMWAIAKQVPVTPYGQDSSRLNDALSRLAHGHRTRRSPGVVSPSAA